MNHDDIRILLSAYLDGEVTPQEKELVEDHLISCTACQKEYKEMQNISSSLKTVDHETLSPDSETNIVRRLESVREGRPMNNRKKLVATFTTLSVMVVMCVLSLQVYYSRGVQGRLRSASDDIGEQFRSGSRPSVQAVTTTAQLYDPAPTRSEGKAVVDKPAAVVFPEGKELESTGQYEPYYLESDYETEGAALGSIGQKSKNERVVRRIDGLQKSKYDADLQKDSRMTRSDASYRQNIHYPSEERLQAAAPAAKAMLAAESSIITNVDEEYRGGDRIDYVARKRRYEPYPNHYHPPAYPETAYPQNMETYEQIIENEFLEVTANALSTLSIDVDTASYSNVRRFLNHGQLPPADAVRIEEMINYFTYDYPEPAGNEPFSITTEIGACPWNPRHQLALVGIQGKTLDAQAIPSSNLVFLIDVSGSMDEPNKLPLVKEGLKMMVHSLERSDRVSMVVYAGAAGVVLDSTPGDRKSDIIYAIDNLSAGGSTAGGQGIELAYDIARRNFIRGGNNRVILATDGDFNVGITADNELVRLIESKRDEGIFLTVLGFGIGNTKDAKMEKLADKGNGNYFYIDTEREAEKVLVHELGSTLFTIAKDVKIQIEFNPAQVKSYRLIGYENRVLAKEDFNDDTKDAGELGAGHTVTALYEIIPAGSWEGAFGPKAVDPLKYQRQQTVYSTELMTVKLRYKEPKGTQSRLITRVVDRKDVRVHAFAESHNFRFASAVAEFGLLLRNSEHKGQARYSAVADRVRQSLGYDPFGYRREFLDLVERARSLSGEQGGSWLPWGDRDERHMGQKGE